MFFTKEWEKLNAVETDYIKLYYYDFKPGYADTYRTYSYHRICTIIDGIKNVSVDRGDSFTYGKDDFVLLSPYAKVNMNIPVNTRALVLELSDNLIDDVSNKISIELEKDVSFNDIDYLHSGMSNFMKNSILSIRDVINTTNKDKDAFFFVDLAVQKLAYSLLKDKCTCNFIYKDIHNPMKEAIILIKEGYDKGITIAYIAEKLYMSSSYFSNKFKKTFGITPIQYLNNYKIEQSTQKLRTQTVSEVSYQLGYTNVSNFIRLFKNKYGITPKQYQLSCIKHMN
ncbi:AraC family transcriptional regulator [Clostridiaceae bacterium M8S5]|nr:AraC family transcriptional regulator [Clostridiaceae bacterium M8S5]